MSQSMSISNIKNAVEITTVSDKKIITTEMEFRNGLTFCRAKAKTLRRGIK